MTWSKRSLKVKIKRSGTTTKLVVFFLCIWGLFIDMYKDWTWLQDDKKFWENFGRFIKSACIEDYGNHKCITLFLQFYLSKTWGRADKLRWLYSKTWTRTKREFITWQPIALTSLDDYIKKMKDTRKFINWQLIAWKVLSLLHFWRSWSRKILKYMLCTTIPSSNPKVECSHF